MSIRLRFRSLPLISVLALTGSLLALPSTVAAGSASTCTVVNRTQGTTYHVLQSAANTASSYDVLQVRGLCFGTTTISQNLFIQGRTTAAGPAILDGDGGGRVLWINAGYTVGIRNLKIRHGLAHYDGIDVLTGQGGGIYNKGRLRLTNVVVRDNRGEADGGGMFVDGGRLALKGNTTVRKNFGGGVLVYQGVMSMWNTSSVYGNTEGVTYGGGVWSEASQFTMNDSSTIFGNAAPFLGGGLYADESGSVTMNDASSIHDNSVASGGGGGISYWCGDVTLAGVVAGGNVHGNSPDDVACS